MEAGFSQIQSHISTDGISYVYYGILLLLISNKIQEHTCTLMRITIQNADKYYNSMVQTLQSMCMHKGFKDNEN